MKSLTILMIITLLTLSFSVKNDELLSGKFELNAQDEEYLFEYYMSQYSTELASNLLSSEVSIEERKIIFVSNLDNIIAHNRNPIKSYTKGILWKFN